MRPPTFQTPCRAWLPLAVALVLTWPAFAAADVIWINEFHYDNGVIDSGEFVEVVILNNGVAPPDLGLIQVSLYDASGHQYDHILLDDNSVVLTSTADADYYVWNPAAIDDGVGGIAMTIGPNTTQFHSYGGVVSATDGAADGTVSTDVGFTESSSTAANQTIGLTGNGMTSGDFFWSAPQMNTSGGLNEGQSFGSSSVPEPTHGWALITIGAMVWQRRKRATS